MIALSRIFAVIALAAASACTLRPERPANDFFDFGPLPAQAGKAELPPLAVPDTFAPPAMDNQNIYYRLAYANAAKPQAYALARWSMPPALLITQRLKSRLAAAGTIVTSGDGANGTVVLRTELDEFTHVFSSAEQSRAVVRIRATLLKGRDVLAQKTFDTELSASPANAEGGAAALARATDLAIDNIMQWVALTPRK